MNATTITKPQITLQADDSLTTTSTAVAEFFGRHHKDVLKKIETLDCSEKFRKANFCALLKTVAMPKGRGTKEITEYEMTEQGFTFLAMGFTGHKAAVFKEAYITTFHAMQTELLNTYKQAVAIPEDMVLVSRANMDALIKLNTKAAEVYDNRIQELEIMITDASIKMVEFRSRSWDAVRDAAWVAKTMQKELENNKGVSA
ncbi:MAG: Rha family transcriptional regulator [Ghiorsea sp.]